MILKESSNPASLIILISFEVSSQLLKSPVMKIGSEVLTPLIY